MVATWVKVRWFGYLFALTLPANFYSMSLVIAGTMAFDAIETPFGKTDRIVGGSAMYAAYSAAHFTNVIKQISIIGYDFPEEEKAEMSKRGIQFEGVEQVADEKSFFWSGRYHTDMNTRDTLVTDLNVLARFNPQVPESYQDCSYLMLGNLMPSLQSQILDQLKNKPKLVVMDTMNFWMDIAWDDLMKVIARTDVLMVNDGEARQLSNEFSLVKAAEKISAMGPKYVIIKKGEHGALLFGEGKIFSAAALPLAEVFDPTGAGDTFAGGFIGYLAKTDTVNFETMKNAIIVGSAMASFCVEKFGAERVKELSQQDIDGRIAEFKQLVSYTL
jgi:sugar/nucleoside kinase (ribokinase family)